MSLHSLNRNFIIAGFLIFFNHTASAQAEGKAYKLQEIGWSFILPADFIVQDSAATASSMARGKKLMEKANGGDEIDVSGTKTLLDARKNLFNLFNVSITGLETPVEDDYKKVTRFSKDMMYNAMLDKVPKDQVDSISLMDTLDGLLFDKFQITIKDNGKELFKMVLMCRLYKGVDLVITYVYMDDKTRLQIENLLKSGKFDK